MGTWSLVGGFGARHETVLGEARWSLVLSHFPFPDRLRSDRVHRHHGLVMMGSFSRLVCLTAIRLTGASGTNLEHNVGKTRLIFQDEMVGGVLAHEDGLDSATEIRTALPRCYTEPEPRASLTPTAQCCCHATKKDGLPRGHRLVGRLL